MKIEFKYIEDWLRFAIQSDDQKLTELINRNFELEITSRSESPLDNQQVLKFHQRLMGHILEEKIWDETLFFFPNPLPDEICNYLICENIALSKLGHTRQSDEIMWELGHHVWEAALTLGKEIYATEKYTLADLKKLWSIYPDQPWLWNSLAYLEASSKEKDTFYNDLLNHQPEFEDIKIKKKELAIARHLKETDSAETLAQYFQVGIPWYFESIAQNPHTPIELLEQLTEMKNIKFARSIRNFAKQNLRLRKS